MNNMNLMQKIYIVLFAVLYLAVAMVSTIHAVSFFGLANNSWMAVVLAISFELGQAAVLFSLLTSNKERGKVMPWVLMAIFTIVQILGNIYSSYKHIMTSGSENLKYFKEPIFMWTNLPDNEATVIVTYIVGAILPLCALLLTSMVTNQFQNPNDSIIKLEENDENKSVVEEKIEEKIESPIVEDYTETEIATEENNTEIKQEIDEPIKKENRFINSFNKN